MPERIEKLRKSLTFQAKKASRCGREKKIVCCNSCQENKLCIIQKKYNLIFNEVYGN